MKRYENFSDLIQPLSLTDNNFTTQLDIMQSWRARDFDGYKYKWLTKTSTENAH